MFVCFLQSISFCVSPSVSVCVFFFSTKSPNLRPTSSSRNTIDNGTLVFFSFFFCRKQKTQAENANRKFLERRVFLFRLVLRTLLSVLSLVVSLQESRLRHTYVHLFLIVQSSGPNGDLFRYHDDEAIPDREKERERERDRKREKER